MVIISYHILANHSFKLYPYDFCIASAILDKKCTIIHHVDYAKVSHVKQETVQSVFNMIESMFGKIKITHDKEPEFLGMKIVCQHDGNLRIGIRPHPEATIE